MSQGRIMIVEDEWLVANDIRMSLHGLGYDVCALVSSGDAAIKSAEELRPDLVLMDIMLRGEMSGIEAAKHIYSSFAIPVIFLTALSDEETLEQASQSLPFGYLIKPFDDRDLHSAIKMALNRRQAEQAVRQARNESENARNFLQTVMDAVADSIVVIDQQYQVQMMNKAARDAAYYGPGAGAEVFCHTLCHQSPEPCSGDAHPCPLREVMRTGRPVEVIHTHTHRNGAPFQVEILASPIFDASGELTHLVEVGRDISERLAFEQERQKLQRRLLEQQKFESIATLAGGVAHDYNNLLTSVLGNAELIHLGVAPPEKVKLFSGAIIHAAQRMAELTNQLLAYAKGGRYQPEALFLQPLVKEALRLACKGNTAGMELAVELKEDLWAIHADPGQIKQMLLNVITNGLEAMGSQTSGRLTVQAENAVIHENWSCSMHNIHQAGDYIRLKVSDTGPGVAPETMAKIFEPFFTTKFIGRGLGLPAAAGIVHNHGGCISLEGGMGMGTTVIILLPRAERMVPELSLEETKDFRGKAMGRKILLVEDEIPVLEVLRDMLSLQGHDVRATATGVEALALMEKMKDELHLVVLDIQMPDMEGKEVFRAIKILRPSLKVLISSGYDQQTALAGISLGPGDRFLQKPYARSLFLEQVEAMLLAL